MGRRMRQNRNEEGFTLFELLIVLIILAILAGIVTFAVGSTQANGAASSCQTDAKAFQTAMEEYKTDVGSYPGAPTPAVPAGTPNNGAVLTTVVSSGGSTYGPFLRQLPATNHYQIRTDGLGNVFVYPASPAHIPGASGAMASTDVGLEVFGDPSKDMEFMNFGTNPAICSDSNVVS
jgi:prepilin-type N-terminal cleavage/methylation domain-containing protein